MATVPLSEFMPYVLPDCPGAPEIAAEGAVLSAAIEFCEKSLLLQRDHDPMTVIPNIADYDLDQTATLRVTKVMKVWYKGKPLDAVAPDDMDDPTIYNTLIGTRTGPPQAYIQKDEDSISLWPCPTERGDSAVTLRVALKPRRAATVLESVLFEDWVEVIAAGAKANLQVTPGKAYSNAIAAGINQTIFVAGINRAMMRANKGHTRANLSVRMRTL